MTATDDLSADELRILSRWLSRMADEAERAAKQSDAGVASGSDGDWQLALLPRIAEFEYRNRRRRADLFDPKFFGEPAWDMLLDLFINHAKGQTVATTSLCIASGVPPTTALRWIGILQDQGLVHRFFCNRDQRLHYVELTSNGIDLISKHLRERLRQLY